MLYWSESKQDWLDIDSMHSKHLQNAMHKIETKLNIGTCSDIEKKIYAEMGKELAKREKAEKAKHELCVAETFIPYGTSYSYLLPNPKGTTRTVLEWEKTGVVLKFY